MCSGMDTIRGQVLSCLLKELETAANSVCVCVRCWCVFVALPAETCPSSPVFSVSCVSSRCHVPVQTSGLVLGAVPVNTRPDRSSFFFFFLMSDTGSSQGGVQEGTLGYALKWIWIPKCFLAWSLHSRGGIRCADVIGESGPIPFCPCFSGISGTLAEKLKCYRDDNHRKPLFGFGGLY